MSIGKAVYSAGQVTGQPFHLLVSIFMKARSMVGSPYAGLNEKVLMQASM